MNQFKTIRGLFLALASVITLLLLLAAAYTSQSLINVQDSWDDYNQSIVKRQQLLMNIKENFGYGGLIHNFKNYVLRATPKYAERTRSRYQILQSKIDEYRALSNLNSKERAALGKIQSVADSYNKMLNIIVPMAEQGASIKAIDGRVKIDDGPALEAFKVLIQQYQLLAEQQSSNIETTLSDYLTLTLIGGVLINLIVVLGNLRIYRFVVVRINQLKATIIHSSQQKDLTLRSNMQGEDEVALTSKAFDGLMDAIQQAVSRFNHSTYDISSATEQLSCLSTETNTLMQQQQKETELVATAMNQMSATVQEVAHSIVDTANAASEATQIASDAGNVVDETVTGIGILAQKIETSTLEINNLQNEANQINSIIEEIEGIASQTNLLALNAAIEAARAGEQGRGFAVVADEVRSLAQSTQGSTEKIKGMIERLQAGVENAVAAMQAGKAQSEGCVESANLAGEALTGIITTVGRISDMSQQIATASEEQSAVTEDLNQNIVSIHQASNKTSSSSDEIRQSSNQLETLTSQLKDVVEAFHIQGGLASNNL